MTRNIFFSYEDSEPLPIAPCRTITITDEIRREDESKKVQIRITWTPRFSDKTKKQVVRKKDNRVSPSNPKRKPSSQYDLQRKRDWDAANTKKLIELGLCKRCKKPKDTTTTRCTACKIIHNEQNRAGQQRRRDRKKEIA